jgi:hypothetical protein
MNSFNDSFLRHDHDRDKAVATLDVVPRHTIVLTNEPGVALQADLDVPRFFEDTSEFRYSAKKKVLKLTAGSFQKFVGRENVCAIVQSPIHSTRIIDLSQITNDQWKLVYDHHYRVWIKSSSECHLPLARNQALR